MPPGLVSEREELAHRVGSGTSQKSSLVIFTYAKLCRPCVPLSLSVIYASVGWVRELRPKTEGEALWRAATVKNLIPLGAVQNRRSSRLRCRARSSARRKLSGQWWISIKSSWPECALLGGRWAICSSSAQPG